MKTYINLFFSFLLGSNFALAQLSAAVIGNAIDQGNNCFTITQDLEFQSGGVWYGNPIDFDDDFTITYQNNFGSKDINGADGMALVFKRNPTLQLGNAGGGMGYQGITSSLIVEFDTYQNNDSQVGFLGDPIFDHIAIMRDGNPFHNSSANLGGPIQASTTSQNIEDGNTHEIKIEWSATSRILRVYFDCELRLALNYNIKDLIFLGDDSVFFGFVGSTGGLANIHEVCFSSISFVDNLQLQDDFICEGGSKIIDATIPSGQTYSWSPTNGISNPNIASPTFSPTTTTAYTVVIADVCGDITTEEFTLSVLNVEEPLFNAVDAICEGDSLPDLPITSTNGITGNWSPAINNSTTTTYTFTPDNPCANTTTMEIIVNPSQTPSFDVVDTICEGDTLNPLPTVSNNGIIGSWSPALDNTTTTTYIFTPDSGQLCAQQTSVEIIVNSIISPLFDVIDPICEGDTIAELPTTSNNGVTGTWSPAINNMATTTYTFTPNTSECAFLTTTEIEVQTKVTPIFDAVNPICEGETLSPLPTLSNNGITGSWSPALNNTETTTYTFVASDGECANETVLTIEVVPNTIPTFDAINPICPGQFLDELPTTSNNGFIGMWSPEINNFETTLYTFTPNSGQGCVASTTSEVVVTAPIIPTFDIVDSICEGSFLNDLPYFSNNGITGVWSPDLNNSETTTYTFTPDANQCAGETIWMIEVIPNSELSISVEMNSEPFSNNQRVIATVTGGTNAYEYQLDNGPWVSNNIFDRIYGCEEHIIKAREISGCSNIASDNFRILEYPKFFTPNGDAFNEIWNIQCLNDQPNARIDIFDRYGKLLVVIEPSRFGWDGTYNGTIMPTDDYWFKVEYIGTDDSSKVFTSHFTLKR